MGDKVAEYIALGERMGLKDDALQKFVEGLVEYQKTQEQKEREERAAEREDRAAERELRMQELKLRECEKEAQMRARMPKLAKFDESVDDIDAYIERFERYAKAQKLEATLWATSLSALLSGKALEAYYRLPAKEIDNYSALKTTLLRRYNMSEEGFRKKFFSTRPEKGETAQQFITRIESYLDKWMAMAGAKKSYEDLRRLVVTERFIEACPDEMAAYLREKKVDSLETLVAMADRFQEAYGVELPSGNKSSRKSVSGSEKKKDDRKCFKCGQEGHLAKSCPKAKTAKEAAAGESSGETRRCFLCGQVGHLARDCTQGIVSVARHETSEVQESCTVHPGEGMRKPLCVVSEERDQRGADCVFNGKSVIPLCSCVNVPMCEGRINGKVCTTMRDTGCSSLVVARRFVEEDQWTGNHKVCILVDGSRKRLPTARVHIDSPFFTGEAVAMVVPEPPFDVILGNLPGVREADNPSAGWKPQNSVEVAQVTTRAQKAADGQAIGQLRVPEPSLDSGDKASLIQEQKEDPTLQKCWARVGDMKETKTARVHFVVQGELLFRIHQSLVRDERVTRQLVVPKGRREAVMRMAHESIMAGHMGTRRTTDRVESHFYWPGLHQDVVRFCASCEVCQKTVPRGRVSRVPLQDMPIIDTPFSRVAVDIVGPISPMSDRKNRYILTIVDYATRYPEAIPLPSIESERVAEALLEVFSRVGFPREILSDMGANFTSALMKEVCRLISLRQLTTTPYHPMCNGLCERFNGTLKQMLKRLCAERPMDWDRYVPAVLFAYREVPQESLGFSPFELVYGRTVRGPIEILQQVWTEERASDEVQSTYGYVMELRERLEKTCKIAHEELRKAQKRSKKLYDRKARDRTFRAGDKVLLLLPTDTNKLLVQWKGPFEVESRVGRCDYRIMINGKARTFHANMLKQYVVRDGDQEAGVQVPDEAEDGTLTAACVPVIAVSEDDGLLLSPVCESGDNAGGTVTWGTTLTRDQVSQGEGVVGKWQHVFSNEPGLTDVCQHEIKVTSAEPIRLKPYPIPFSMKDVVSNEIDKMLRADIIEESDSPYSSPVVLVKKKDKSVRFCVDYRRLNDVTVFDCEPMPQIDEVLSRLEGDQYFTKLDLTKGYWQISVKQEDRQKTAFSVPGGHHFQFKRMPFGLVNSAATFNRMMRKVMGGMAHVDCFVDDVLIHTPDWEMHLQVLDEVLARLEKAGLTVKPAKCVIGADAIPFVGQDIGRGWKKPQDEKIRAITEVPVPKTKKEVRAFVGLVGFYRSYIRDFASIAKPLTDLTKKKHSVVKWSGECETAFRELKRLLSEGPVLKVVDLKRKFVLQTDASDVGVGAALLQEYDEGLFPVAFASKKLSSAERNYSVIERECLAIVWGIQKFYVYLYGVSFVVETDHQPLECLKRSTGGNGRILRWTLYLQNFSFTIRAIRGSENVVADYLSRVGSGSQ